MFGPDYTAGCPSCSAIADGYQWLDRAPLDRNEASLYETGPWWRRHDEHDGH